MMISHTRRALAPVEIGILEEVGRLRPTVKRDAYRKFIGRKVEGKHAETKLSLILSRLIREWYVRPKADRRGRERLVLAAKAKNAVKRARACTPD